MKRALLVIDMLVDFLEEGGALFCGKEALKIIPFIQNKIDEVRADKGIIIYICDAHEKNDLEFKRFPKHSIEGTSGAQIIKELKPAQGDIVIKKKRFSGFYGTPLEGILKKHSISIVEVVGVCTSICVMDTVGDLRNRDYPVTIYREGVADFDPEAHNFALKRMEKIYGAKVV
jgi:nicotinamidase-related amidase